MMRYKSIAVAIALCCSAMTVQAADCSRSGELTGRVDTVNLNDKLQYGTTQITITRDGKNYFSATGVIIGQVVGMQDNGLPILNHSAYFADGTQLQTRGDIVEQLVPTGKFENGVPCEFSAVEHITDASGNKQLSRLTSQGHDVKATGTVSYCSDNNRNHFELYGTVCFK